MGPSPVAPAAETMALLSLVVPVLAITIVLIAMPPVRRVLTDRLVGLRLFLVGPTLEVDGPDDSTEEDLPVDTPGWLDMSLYDEATEDDEHLADAATPDGEEATPSAAPSDAA